MANLPESFNPNNYESKGDGDFKMIPPGDYLMVMTDSDLRQNKKQNGEDIAAIFEITEGEYKGRKLFHDFKYTHQNATAEIIGREELAFLTKATGYVGELRNTDVLQWKAVFATVTAHPEGSKERDYTFTKDTNKIKGKSFRAAEGVASTAPASQAPAATGAKPPWQRAA